MKIAHYTVGFGNGCFFWFGLFLSCVLSVGRGFVHTFGLVVVKRMTESLGGTVTFESQEGKGTTFTVRLPTPRS
jgi:hypothetical protein